MHRGYRTEHPGLAVIRFVHPWRTVGMGAPLGSEHVALLLNQVPEPGSNVVFVQHLCSTTGTLQWSPVHLAAWQRLHEKKMSVKQNLVKEEGSCTEWRGYCRSVGAVL